MFEKLLESVKKIGDMWPQEPEEKITVVRYGVSFKVKNGNMGQDTSYDFIDPRAFTIPVEKYLINVIFRRGYLISYEGFIYPLSSIEYFDVRKVEEKEVEEVNDG